MSPAGRMSAEELVERHLGQDIRKPAFWQGSLALVAAAVSTGTGIRDQETTLATEAVFLNGSSNAVLAQVVRKGTGKPLENDSQVLQANDVKGVIDGWASDLHQSYLKLKNH